MVMNSNDELGLRRKTSESFFPSLIIFPFGISFHLPNHQSPSYFLVEKLAVVPSILSSWPLFKLRLALHIKRTHHRLHLSCFLLLNAGAHFLFYFDAIFFLLQFVFLSRIYFFLLNCRSSIFFCVWACHIRAGSSPRVSITVSHDLLYSFWELTNRERSEKKLSRNFAVLFSWLDFMCW